MCNIFLNVAYFVFQFYCPESCEFFIIDFGKSIHLFYDLQLVRTMKPLVRIPDFKSHLRISFPLSYLNSLGLFSPFQDFKPFVSIPDPKVTFKFSTRAYLLDFKIQKLSFFSKLTDFLNFGENLTKFTKWAKAHNLPSGDVNIRQSDIELQLVTLQLVRLS